ncbi:hypothetical protein C1645_838937 [Glomus cerebriforme]|uniref:Uncharacterized protein n=1 Tax=Glomus cerebriforme TaxID=658196 RepID=A0A397S485_9GLOM|nr:hypothetical protein C1645_838937 [Glomus cerebriforme]
MSLSQTVKACSSTIKAEEIADVSNATIVDRETAELLENKPKKTLEEMRSLDRHHIVDCYEISPESLTENFISKYGNYNHMKWFRAYKQLRDAGTNNETAVGAISRKDYREDRLTTATQAERHRICLELLRICTPARDIDDRVRYKSEDVKMHGSFDTKDAPRLPSYQTGEEIYWENGEDTRYGYSNLPPDELILDNFTSSSKMDNTQITGDIQERLHLSVKKSILVSL